MVYLLDTDTCIDVLRGHPRVSAHLRQQRPTDCALSVVTLHELATGALKSKRPASHQAALEAFIAPLPLLPFEAQDSWQSAKLRRDLENRGRKIGPYDLLLAAQSMRHGLKLVSSNASEFSRIDGLHTVSWRT